MKKLIITSALALTTALGLAATATPAKADILVNYDGGTITLGQTLDGGVWYQSFSGGPAGYWEGVYSYPQRKWIFTRSGQASPAIPMKIWYVRPSERGEYATVYGTDSGGRAWRSTFYTAVKRQL
jgi:hypothetical protein